jgi:hypothetical protein
MAAEDCCPRVPALLPKLDARNANGRWTYPSHQLAGMAVILLYTEGASKQGFPLQAGLVGGVRVELGVVRLNPQ